MKLTFNNNKSIFKTKYIKNIYLKQNILKKRTNRGDILNF